MNANLFSVAKVVGWQTYLAVCLAVPPDWIIKYSKSGNKIQRNINNRICKEKTPIWGRCSVIYKNVHITKNLASVELSLQDQCHQFSQQDLTLFEHRLLRVLDFLMIYLIVHEHSRIQYN